MSPRSIVNTLIDEVRSPGKNAESTEQSREEMAFGRINGSVVGKIAKWCPKGK